MMIRENSCLAGDVDLSKGKSLPAICVRHVYDEARVGWVYEQEKNSF